MPNLHCQSLLSVLFWKLTLGPEESGVENYSLPVQSCVLYTNGPPDKSVVLL